MPVFFDISPYLRGKYFDPVSGVPPFPWGTKWTPENQFFERLNLRCQCFFTSVGIYEENILTWFGGTNPLEDQNGPSKINFFIDLI